MIHVVRNEGPQTCLCSNICRRRSSMKQSIIIGLLMLICYHFYRVQSRGNHSGYALPVSMRSLEVTAEMGANETCKQRLPKCIIIGVQKCGTSALLQFLDLHPHISAVLEPEEMKFFSGHYEEGMDWYLRQMTCSKSNQITIEKSPSYFFRDYVPERIKAMNSSIKLILTVKDPISRAISEYVMDKDHGFLKGNANFEDRVIEKRNWMIREGQKFINHSLYHFYLKPWLRTFKLEQIHIVDGNRLIRNPSKEIQRIEKFLGLGNFFQTQNFMYNKTKGFYCYKSESSKPMCLRDSKGRSHPTISHKSYERLKKFFTPHNDMFFKMIGRKFNWGY